MKTSSIGFLLTIALLLAACDRTDADIYAVASGCYAIAEQGSEQYLAIGDNGAVGFSATTLKEALSIRLRATDLGMYALYTPDRSYIVATSTSDTYDQAGVTRAEDWTLSNTNDFDTVRILPKESFSVAEWYLESASRGDNVYELKHARSGLYLDDESLSEDSGTHISLVEHSQCAEFPELALDASGDVRSEPFSNGDVYGVVDAHSHLFTNLSFGGGGVYHGAPYHRLGVEHALSDCEENHGVGGRRDIVNYFFSGEQDVEIEEVVTIFTAGEVEAYNHATTGYPEFVAWPNARKSPTHQVQYYRWLERAYMGGLRLIVQLATGNSVLCKLLKGLESQEMPYECNDMDTVDRTIEHTFALERYIDAQAGGPGKGWFRIVYSPEEARDVINQGKMAVVTGIEITNLFDCFLHPTEDDPVCDAEYVKATVEHYYQQGIRVVFPVHKFDNAFAPGDGSRGALEIGNVVNASVYSDFVSGDCPQFGHSFDKGDVVFGGLNVPREDYFDGPDFDFTDLESNPLKAVAPLVSDITEPKLEGDYCKAHGVTDIGKVLLDELMKRGMIVDIAHLPKKAMMQTLDIFEQRKYPSIATHGDDILGRIYQFGGMKPSGFAGCNTDGTPGRLAEPFLRDLADIQEANGIQAVGLSFDFNGFAGGRRPRFGAESHCSTPQANGVEYPFKSFDGGVSFSQPTLGVRQVDYNTEGMLHIGLLPELIEDVRRDGASDEAIEPLFRSAEAFIQTWENIEAAAN